MPALLPEVIQCGRIAIEQGRLILEPDSGDQEAANQLLEENREQLLAEILEATGVMALEYTGYATGHYGANRHSALTVQFVDVATGEARFCCFNVDLKRKRNSGRHKAGGPLPEGQFHPPRGGAFLAFWKRAGLKQPRRLSAFHDYMGRLKSRLLTGEVKAGEKLDNASLRVLEITHQQIARGCHLEGKGLPSTGTPQTGTPRRREGCYRRQQQPSPKKGKRLLPATTPRTGRLPDKSRTTPGQFPDNSRTDKPDKESAQSKRTRGLQPFSGTGGNNHSKRLTGTQVTGGTCSSDSAHKSPQPARADFCQNEKAGTVDGKPWAKMTMEERRNAPPEVWGKEYDRLQEEFLEEWLADCDSVEFKHR